MMEYNCSSKISDCSVENYDISHEKVSFSAIKTLARNDANKKLLVQLGALKLLAKLAKGNTEEKIGKSNGDLIQDDFWIVSCLKCCLKAYSFYV